jgi:uncharacterized protein (TIGR03437 family)
LTVTIGGVNAQVMFAGITGAGLYQINVIVPDVPAGDQKIILTIQRLQTQDGVFVAVTKPATSQETTNEMLRRGNEN